MLLKFLKSQLKKFRLELAQKKASKEDIPPIPLKIKKLNRHQKQLIKEKWSGLIDNLDLGYIAYLRYISLDKFDVNYVPSSYYYPLIIRALNPINNIASYEHKGLNIFNYPPPFLQQPDTVLNSIRGIFYDSENVKLTFDEALDKLSSFENDMIIKPSTGSCSGRNVRMIKRNTDSSEIASLLKDYNGDFIVQKKVDQSQFTGQFNPTSLNTMRIPTLYINGKFSVLAAILKIGADGAIVDNMCSGSGSTWVEINPDGTLKEWGRNKKLETVRERNGISFANKKVPNFSKIINTVKQAHLMKPAIGLIGWDIALNSDNEPLFIEANLFWPSVKEVQDVHGPLFGERLDEVIQYTKSYHNIH